MVKVGSVQESARIAQLGYVVRKLRKLCTDVGLSCKQKYPFLTLPQSNIEARNASGMCRFVMIIALVNLLYAVTPD